MVCDVRKQVPFVAGFYLIGSAFCLALGSVLAKGLLGNHFLTDAGSAIHPLAFVCIQLFGSLCFLLTVALGLGTSFKLGSALARLVCAGLVVAAGAACTISALHYTSASVASVIFATQPAMIIVLAWALLKEPIGAAIIILGVAAFCGIAIMVGFDGNSTAANQSLGNAFALLATAAAALYVVWMRRVVSGADPLASLIVVQSVALVALLIGWIVSTALWPQFAGSPIQMPGNWAAAVSAAMTGTIYYGMAFYIYLLGLKRIPAARAGMFLNLVPVFTIAIAYVLLGEVLTPAQWIGAFVVLVAVSAIPLAARLRHSGGR